MARVRSCGWMALALGSFGAAAPARGDFVEYTNRADWVAAVGPFATIHFNEVPNHTFILDEYADLGVIFTDGNDQINFNPTYVNDSWGIDGNGDINLVFDTPRFWMAIDHPNGNRFVLFRRGQLVYEGPWHVGGMGSFAGIVATEPFDAVAILGPKGGQVEIDDLHFQPGPCLGDLDGSAEVDPGDLASLLAAWGTGPGRGGGDLDGDGQVGMTDLLALLANWGPCPFFVDCNGNEAWDYVDLMQGASPDCNLNGIPDECDLAGPQSTDYDGNGVPDECQVPVNDACDQAAPVANGQTPFLTVAATTGGPFAICDEGTFVFLNDVWFLYTPPCTGFATIHTSDTATNFDTLLAVYFAGCPVSSNPLACSDDDLGCGDASEVTLLVVQGIPYLVRVGGFFEGGGYGVLTVSCGAPP